MPSSSRARKPVRPKRIYSLALGAKDDIRATREQLRRRQRRRRNAGAALMIAGVSVAAFHVGQILGLITVSFLPPTGI